MELELRQALFWDLNVAVIDLQQHQASVIERITTRGRLEELRAMVAYYGQETVKNTLLQARYLDKRTLAYCSLIFDVSVTEFSCINSHSRTPNTGAIEAVNFLAHA